MKKFRVWNKESKSWLKDTSGIAIDLNGELVAASYAKTFLPVSKSFVYVQYLGKDKNKKEVYENDIAKMITKIMIHECEYDCGTEVDFYCEYIGVVKQGVNGLYLKNITITNENKPHGITENGNFISTIPKIKKLVLRRSELIGNIYENPHIIIK